MKLSSTLLAVSDMERSVAFYGAVLGLRVVRDFGANKTLTGGLVLQTAETFASFLDAKEISFGGNQFELYFEEDDFDGFVRKLQVHLIDYVHPVKEHSWGQRVVRFYDPDHHIIEVGENIHSVCRRFLNSGMTVQQVAVRMDVPESFVEQAINS